MTKKEKTTTTERCTEPFFVKGYCVKCGKHITEHDVPPGKLVGSLIG